MRSQHQFSQTPSVDMPRSNFDLSYPVKTTFDADLLVPIARPLDIIPGDTISWNSNFFMRLATPIHPIMDNLYFESFAFFVPYRIIWDNFEKFHGAQDDPSDSIDFTIPVFASGTVTTGTLGDYFGMPLSAGVYAEASCLPHRAYAKCWIDWFRDENLQDSLNLSTADGPDSLANYTIQKRGKRFDYFTSCLPWPQKGGASVSLPLGTVAPVRVDTVLSDELGLLNTDGDLAALNASTATVQLGADAPTAEPIYADLSTATSATINDLRLAVQTQALLERDARMGTRYPEVLKAHWGTTSPDHRLQRAEFLGGGSTRINVTPVAQTSGQPTPAANDKLGELAGFGTVSGTHSWTQSFVEHGVVIILGSVRSDITYSQGLDRYWSKSTRYDFMYPILSQLGEQSVLNKEIYFQNTSADDDVFGYQERYAEYRYQSGLLSGLMRPDASGSLDVWHLSEEFTALPTLGSTFIESNTADPLDRAIAIPSEPHIIADIFHQVRAARPMPLYGIPGSLARL